MTKPKPMNVDWLVETAKRFTVEYEQTPFMAFYYPTIPDVEGVVHIDEHGLLELKPVSGWTWEKRENYVYRWEASVIVDKVKFCAILTRSERNAILAGTYFDDGVESKADQPTAG